MVVDIPTESTRRPYPPASNVVSVLHRLRSRNLPDRIDADYLIDSGISESLVQRVLFGLEFLNLIQSEMPTAELRRISTSTDEEYQAILEELLRDAYSEVFAVVDPVEDSQERILNVFRRYSPASQRTRMVSFFLGMCREAGLPVLDAPRQRPMNESPKKPARSQSGRNTSGRAKSTPQGRVSGHENRQLGAGDIPPALEVLIRSLPPQGATLSAIQRSRWLDLAQAALAYAYPDPHDQANEGLLPEVEDVEMMS